MSGVLGATGSAGSGLLHYIDSSGNDYIYIRSTEPFWGIFFELRTANAGATAPFQSVEYSAGSGSWTSMTSKDSTLAFTQDGCLAFLPTADPYAAGLWVTDTVDSVSGYWIRITPDVTMTDTVLSKVYICPYRPAIGEDEIPFSAQALAGVLPKILVGTWAGERIIWQDVWTLESARVMKMLVGRTRGANSTGNLTLWAFCQDDIFHMPIGPEADPARAAWPPTESSTPHWQQESSIDFGEVVEVKRLLAHTKFLQEEDELWLYTRWDNSAGWEKDGAFTQTPAIREDVPGHGRILHVAWAIKDATRDATAPYLEKIEIPSLRDGGWNKLEPEDEPLEPQIASPQES